MAHSYDSDSIYPPPGFSSGAVVTRTNDEESRTFNILRKLDRLVKRGVIDGDVRHCLMVIDETNKQPY